MDSVGSSQNGTSTIQQVKQVQKVLRVQRGQRGGAVHSHMEAPRSFEYTLSLENKKPVNPEPLEPLPLQPQRPLDLMQER